MQQIKICTAFDITPTGVHRPYRQQNLPAIINNLQINTVEEWNHYRRQHSNWQTVLQVLLFRTQPVQMSDITSQDDVWCFTFVNETTDVFLLNTDPVGALRQDFEGTPIIVGLDEKTTVLPYIHTHGENQNIWITEI